MRANKRYSQFLRAAILIIVGAGCACGQVKSPSSKPKQMEPPPGVPPEKTFGKATAYYTKGFDAMEVASESWVIGNSNGPFMDDRLLMTAYFRSPGKMLARPQSMHFVFESHSQALKYGSDRKLQILVDGIEFASGETLITHSECRPRIPCEEVMKSPELPYNSFLQIINAKKVEMRLGPTGFELRQENIEALRDLDRIVQP
jgi:hypothetical protein